MYRPFHCLATASSGYDYNKIIAPLARTPRNRDIIGGCRRDDLYLGLVIIIDLIATQT